MDSRKPILIRASERLSPLVFLSSNAVSLTGVVIVTAVTVSWLFLLPMLFRGSAENPYIGILGFLVLPGVFVIGLLLIPLGIAIRRRRVGSEKVAFPPLSFESVELRRLVGFIAVTTLANLVIASQWGYSAVVYMETPSFCGLACHGVMQPEFSAYQVAPHSNVDCIKCHAGPGATGFVRAKLAGVNQLMALTFNTYSRPIPAPVHNLRPANETCQNCHSLKSKNGDRLHVVVKFADDEHNTATRTVLMTHVASIHAAHMGDGVSIRFSATPDRGKISWIERTAAGGQTTSFSIKNAQPGDSLRTMDCLDCHNRPAHTFEVADKAVDRAMLDGYISAALPFAKKQAVEALTRTYTSHADAAANIPVVFRQSYPQAVYQQHQAEIDRAADRLVALYQRNVFPQMKVGWGTYPNHLGHNDFTGCFRCHDEEHVSSAGKKISQDCGTCHNLVAMDEASPKILTDLGIAPGAK